MKDFLAIAMLLSGDQIMGVFTSYGENYEYYMVKESVILKPMMSEKGMGSIPSMFPTKDKEIMLRKHSLSIYPAEPLDELKDMYKKLFSNIVIPKVIIS